MIDGEKHSLNSGNSTDCADIMISDDATDELIATAINYGDSSYSSGSATGGLIAAINAGNLTYCEHILF